MTLFFYTLLFATHNLDLFYRVTNRPMFSKQEKWVQIDWAIRQSSGRFLAVVRQTSDLSLIATESLFRSCLTYLFLISNNYYDHLIVSDLTMEKNSGWSSINFLLVIAQVTSVGILEPTLPTFCASIINATVNLYPKNWLQKMKNWLQKMKTMLRQPRLNRLKNNAQQRLQ